jgi:hypothetical protein
MGLNNTFQACAQAFDFIIYDAGVPWIATQQSNDGTGVTTLEAKPYAVMPSVIGLWITTSAIMGLGLKNTFQACAQAFDFIIYDAGVPWIAGTRAMTAWGRPGWQRDDKGQGNGLLRSGLLCYRTMTEEDCHATEQ